METINQKATRIVKQYIVAQTPSEQFDEDFYFNVYLIYQANAGDNWSFIFKTNLDISKLYIIEYIAQTSSFEMQVYTCVDSVTTRSLTKLKEQEA